MAISDELIYKIKIDGKKAKKDLKEFAVEVTGINQAIEASRQVFQKFESVINITAGAFARFEKSIVGVTKTTNLTNGEMRGLTKTLKDLSTVIPVSTNALLQFSQTAGQLGVEGEANLANFAETIAKVGVSTNLTGDEAATAFTRILNVVGEPISRIDEFASVVVALGNNFAATESEITKMTNEVARATAVFGVASDQAAGFSAAMRSVGIRTELGGTALGKFFRRLDVMSREGGKALEQINAVAGTTGDEFRRIFEKDATKAAQIFLAGLGKMINAGVSASDTLEVFGLKGDEINKVIPILAKRVDLLGESLALANKEMQNATALNIEAAKAYDTLSSDFERAKNSLVNLGATIGEVIAPALRLLLNIVTTVVDAIDDFIQFSKNLIIVLGVGGLVAAITLLAKQLIFLNTATAASVAGFKALGVVASTSPFEKLGKSFKDLYGKVFNFLQLNKLFTAVLSGNIAGVISWVKQLTVSFSKLFLMLLKNPLTYLIGLFALVTNAVVELQQDMNLFGKAWEVFFGTVEKTNKELAKTHVELTFMQKVMTLTKGSIVTLTEGFFYLMSLFGGEFGKRAAKFKEELAGIRMEMRDLFINGRKIGDGVGSGFNKAAEGVNSLANGLNTLSSKLEDIINLGSKAGSELGSLKLVESFGGGEVGNIEAAYRLEKDKLDLMREQVFLTEMSSSKRQAALNKIIAAEQKIFNLKNFKQQLAFQTKIKAVSDKIVSSQAKVSSIGQKIKLANAGTFDKIRLQGEFAKKAIDTDIQNLNIQLKKEQLILKNMRAENANVKALQEQKKVITEIRDLQAQKATEKSAVDQNTDNELQNAGISMATGFVNAAQGGADALLGNIIDTVGAAFGPVGQMVAGIVNMLRQGFDFMKTLGKDLLLMIVELPKQVAEGLKGLLTGIIEAIMELFSDPDMMVDMLVSGLTVGLELMTIVFKALPKLIKKIFSLKFWMEVLEGIWIALRDAFVQAWDAFWAMFTGEGLADTVGSALIEGIEMATDTLGGFGQKLFSVVGDAVGLSADDEGSGVGGKADDKSKTSNFLQGFIDVWRDIYDFFESLLVGENSIWAMVYRGVAWFGEGIWDGLKDMLAKIPEFLMNGITGLANFVVSVFTELPAKLLEGAKNIVSGLWNAVEYFFKPFFDLVMAPFTAIGKFLTSLKDKFLGLFKFPSSQGTVEKWMKVDIPFLKFAEGGKVPNPSGAPMSRGNNFRNDVVPAMLSPDEFVLPRSITQDSKKMTLIQKVIKGEESYFGWGSNFIAGVKKVASGKASVGDVIKEGSDLVKDVSDKTGVSKVLESAESLFNKLSSTLRTVYNWVKKNIGGIDLKAFIANPVKEALRAIKQGITAFIKPLTGGIFENMFGQQFGGTSGQTKDMSATSSKMSVTSSAIKTLNKAMRSFKFPSFSFHTGGMVGNDGMANLLGGEFVINRRAVNNIGAANLGNLNLTGGQGAMGNSLTMGDVNVTIVQADSQQLDGREMAEQFMEELKNRSLRGDFVISQRGIR